MTRRPLWNRSAPEELGRYVEPAQVRALLSDPDRGFPEPDASDPLVRAKTLYDLLASRGVRYVHEPPEVEPGYQEVRSAAEVLAPRTGAGTCVDIAVVMAGACVSAGLRPLLVLLDPVARGPGHAVVLVRIRGGDQSVQGRVPEGPADLVAEPGSFAAIDVTMAAADRPAGTGVAPPASFEDAMKSGFGYVSGAAGWTWRGPAVDVVDTPAVARYPAGPQLVSPLLANPYLDGADLPVESLAVTRAEYAVVPFQARDEVDSLVSWCEEPIPPESARRVVVVEGMGGAGKTRLAAELCRLQAEQGQWHTGFLLTDPGGDPVVGDHQAAWLGSIVSPLLVVIDYADGHLDDVFRVAGALRGGPGWRPWRLLLTTRGSQAVRETLTGRLQGAGLLGEPQRIELPPVLSSADRLFLRAVRRFSRRDAAGRQPALPRAGRPDQWTTLDVVLLAWLSVVTGGADLPDERGRLYDEVMGHELKYWAKVGLARGYPVVSSVKLQRAAACATLLQPSAAPLAGRVEAVIAPAVDAAHRDGVADVLRACVASGPGGTVALRPDPIGDHVALQVFAAAPALYRAALATAGDEELARAVAVLDRAGTVNRAVAAALAGLALRDHADLFGLAWPRATTAGGPWADALVALLGDLSWTAPVDLNVLHDSVPSGHAHLRSVALAAAQRLVDTMEAEPPGEQARRWNNLAARLSEVGRRGEALGAIQEAVDLRRGLAQAAPDAFTPNLAMSLNNLATRLSEVGRRGEALGAIQESVELYRGLARAAPDAFTPDLAASLNNLATRLSEVGRRGEALGAIQEAVELYRGLAQAAPDAFTPDLAMSLNNLATLLSEVGRRGEALGAIQESVELYRGLAQAAPDAYAGRLETSLRVLTGILDEMDRAEEADAAWFGAAAGLAHHPGASAELLGGLVASCAGRSRREPAAGALAQILALERSCEGPAQLGRVRRAARRAVEILGVAEASDLVAGLPGWG